MDDPYSGLYDDDDDDNPETGQSVQIGVDDEPEDGLVASDETRNLFWGYGIHQMIKPDADLGSINRIAKSKLLLDTSPKTEPVREKLRSIVDKLRKKTKRAGKTYVRAMSDEDIIADYLTQLFLHAKDQLITVHGIPNNVVVEHVLCVPVVWKAKACRTMERAMETAIRASGLGTSKDLFLVSEPEAAAAYIIGKNKVINVRVFSLYNSCHLINHNSQPEENFLILDAGGGTVDATTYKLTKDYPLRLSEQLVTATGMLC